jgi:uncharacterized membrane protein YidH (DUF202 family)
MINILISLFFMPIWLEYGEALITGKTARLLGNNISLDILMIIITMGILIISILIIINYFRNKRDGLILPVACIIIYIGYFIIQFII